MAKDDSQSGDTDLSRPSDTNGIGGGESESVSEGLRVRTLVFLEGRFRGQPDEPLVDRTQATTTDATGLLETTSTRFKVAAACGHVVHTGQELGLQCTSCIRLHRPEPSLLCTECARDDRNACSVCNAIVCRACRQQRWMEGELRTVCRACIRTRLRWQLIKTTARYVAAAVGLYYVIFC